LRELAFVEECNVIDVQADRERGFFTLVFRQKVTEGEAKLLVSDIERGVAGMPRGFRLLADFSDLDSMEMECAPLIARVMDLCNEAGIGKVIRIIPDPRKDIGLRIMSLFHYNRDVRILTFDDKIKAEKALE
jgi:hypothetical protein